MFDIIIERVTELSTVKGEKPITSMKNAGIGYNFFVHLRDNKKPSVEKIIKLADYFDTSLDYLLGRTENISSNVACVSINERLIISKYKQLNNDGQLKAIEYLDDLISSNKYSNADNKKAESA